MYLTNDLRNEVTATAAPIHQGNAANNKWYLKAMHNWQTPMMTSNLNFVRCGA